MTMIVVTHEMNFAREIGDRAVCMDSGTIVEVGSPRQIFDNPTSPRLRTFLSRFSAERPPVEEEAK